MRCTIYILLALLLALHHDFWLWDDPTPWFGLPAGLAYHVLYSLAVAGVWALAVRFAWPRMLDEAEHGDA